VGHISNKVENADETASINKENDVFVLIPVFLYISSKHGCQPEKKKKRTKYNVDIITMCTKVRRAFYSKVEQEDLAGSKMAGSRYFRPLAPTAL
jgi:hypothetical protein